MTNFFLLCLSFGVIFMVIRSHRSRKVEYIMPILIVSFAVLLSIIYEIEKFCFSKPELVFPATFCFFLGFAIRPLILYFFMRLTIRNKVILSIALGLIILNAIVYSFTLFINVPGLSHLIYWLEESNGVLDHHRGPLYYFSYFIVGAMIIYFVIFSIRSLTGMHRFDAMASLICLVFVGVAVVLETILYDSTLLNTTVAIACIFYVVHLYQRASKRDGLTGLYDRKTYYADAAVLGTKITAVTMVDMNYLKYINDTKGHLEGDIAINTVAQSLEKSVDKRWMYVYRLGGDEFLIVSTATKPELATQTIQKIRDTLSATPYSASLGLAVRSNMGQTPDELFKEAEEAMYEDKKEFYEKSGIERRKAAPVDPANQ